MLNIVLIIRKTLWMKAISITVKPVVFPKNNAQGRKWTNRGFHSSQDENRSLTGHCASRQEKHAEENGINLSAGTAKKMSWSDTAWLQSLNCLFVLPETKQKDEKKMFLPHNWYSNYAFWPDYVKTRLLAWVCQKSGFAQRLCNKCMVN